MLPVFAVAVTLVAAACGGSASSAGVATLQSAVPAASDPAASAAPVDFQQALLDYTQCLRDNGVDVADPQFGADGRPEFGGAADGGGQFGDVDTGSPEFQAAQEACGDLIVGAQRQIDPEGQAERQAQLLVFAECMRDEGIDFPDPQLGTGGGGPGFGGGGFADLDFQSTEVQAALDICRADLGGFGPGSGPGASAGTGD